MIRVEKYSRPLLESIVASEPSLSDQISAACATAKLRITGLNATDPLRDWFEFELGRLGRTTANAGCDASAQLSGLRQLQYLIDKHYKCLGGAAEESNEFPDSYRTSLASLPSNVVDAARELGFTIEPGLLHDQTPDNDHFDPVSPTAKVVTYLRSLEQSPQPNWNAHPAAEGCEILRSLGVTEPETLASMAVLFLSRYHAINALMAKDDFAAKQIIEFAAGISPRGYQWANMSPGTIYVESDLPQLMLRKSKLVRNSCIDEPIQPKGFHHCRAVDVLDSDSMMATLDNLDAREPFTIVTEGLLLYFGGDEMNQFLGNISRILQQFPNSRWVSDIVSKANLHELFASHEGVARAVKGVFSKVGREVVPNNPFESDACVHESLAKHQLACDHQIQLSDTVGLFDFADVQIPASQRKQIVGKRSIWRIRAAD